MGYEEYKKILINMFNRELAKKKEQLTTFEAEVKAFNFASNLILADRSADIKNITEMMKLFGKKYRLSFEVKNIMDIEEFMEQLGNLRDEIRAQIKIYEDFLESVRNDFNKPVADLPLFMISMFYFEYTNGNDLGKIFAHLLRANAKGHVDITKTSKKDDVDYLKLEQYEKELYKLFKKKDWVELKKIYASYIECFLGSKALMDFFNETVELDKSELIGAFEEILNITIREYMGSSITISDKVIKIYKDGFTSVMRSDLASLDDLDEFLNLLAKWQYTGVSEFLRMNFVCELNKYFRVNIRLADSLEVIYQKLLAFKDVLIEDVIILDRTMSLLSTKGFRGVNEVLPRTCFSVIGEDPDIQKLILSGIKYNSLFRTEPTEALGKSLYELELKMGEFISDDLKIDLDNKDEFLKLYKEYLEMYVGNIYPLYSVENNEPVNLKNHLPLVLSNMKDYISKVSTKNSVPIRKGKIIRSESVNIPVKPNYLAEYIKDGKVIKLISPEEFKRILEQTDLSIDQKNEALRQMNNAINRKIVEEKNELLKSILDSDIIYYEEARMSGKPEALQIVNEIDAIIDMVYESTDLEEKEELKRECLENASYLEEMFRKPEETLRKENTYNILYYKVVTQPSILTSIESLNKNIRKQASATLKKIIEGNTTNDLTVKGDLPIKVWFKGKDFKVFYTKIGNYTFIIDGFQDEDAFIKLKGLVNRREFLEYFKQLTNNIKHSNVNDNDITKDILDSINNGVTRK